MSKVVNMQNVKRKMKLKDLSPVLRNDRINLYIEPNKPIKFDLWGWDDKTGLSEYRPLDDCDPRENDTMFLDYGDYIVEEIGVEPIEKEEPSHHNEGTLWIAISKS